MKILDIVLKDLTHSRRSYFALVFMFGVPLLMAGMFYFMFGSQAKDNKSFPLPVTKVVMANLDEGGPGFERAKSQFPNGSQASSMGEMILTSLQSESFANLMEISVAASADEARTAVDKQEAGAAIIIPPDFSAKFSSLSEQATIELYKDPTLTLGPGIVEAIMAQFMDGMSGARIAVQVSLKQTNGTDPQAIGMVIQQYMAASSSGDQSNALLDVRAPTTAATPKNLISGLVGMILGGMTIFYAFFTGASSTQSILTEEEKGTLPRLFTTPTAVSKILGGKFLAVCLTVSIQMIVMLILGRLIFGIQWGAFLPLAIITIGTILAASGFGIALISFMKSSKQGGVIFGGVVTTTGMVGMIKIFTMGVGTVGWADKISLIVPQGWAVRGLTEVMNGATTIQILPLFGGLVVIGVALFVIGVLRFQKRFA
jgi:ABC-2 type transport system permease protein